MEKEEVEIILKGGFVQSEIYKGTDISELENGALFGLVVGEDSFYFLKPGYYYDDGQIKNDISIINDSSSLIYGDDDNYYTYFDDHKIMLLIFKKIKDNYIQEILTGNIFLAASPEKLKYEDSIEIDSVEDFDNKIKKYSSVSVLINTARYDDEGKISVEEENSIFIVDDGFKKVYSDLTLKNKDEITRLLNCIKKNGEKLFNDGLKEFIDECQSIAETENLLFDLNAPKLK